MSKCPDCGFWEEPGHEDTCLAHGVNENDLDIDVETEDCRTEAEDEALFTEHIPVSVICRVRVARMLNGRVVDEIVSGEVALYHPYDQLPSLVNRVLGQLGGRG
jgi:hypothetical protein